MSTDPRQLIHDTLKSGVLAPEKGKPKTTLQALGWTDALESYRPFLSYNELGSMLDEGPSKLHDALSLVLGLEDSLNIAPDRLRNNIELRIERRHAVFETVHAPALSDSRRVAIVLSECPHADKMTAP